jgi:predicted lysophospholipase L1 biosynthesis ABC-type transport system permease subunit
LETSNFDVSKLLYGQGLNWQQYIFYSSTGQFSDEQKLTMLQTAVHPLQELCQVKTTAVMLKVHTQKDLEYDAYSSLYYPLLLIVIVSIVLVKLKDKYMHMT